MTRAGGVRGQPKMYAGRCKRDTDKCTLAPRAVDRASTCSWPEVLYWEYHINFTHCLFFCSAAAVTRGPSMQASEAIPFMEKPKNIEASMPGIFRITHWKRCICERAHKAFFDSQLILVLLRTQATLVSTPWALPSTSTSSGCRRPRSSTAACACLPPSAWWVSCRVFGAWHCVGAPRCSMLNYAQ